MHLQAGNRLGHYEVRAPLGAGGMGEVYRGHDARLGRDVAIKVLPDEIADAERLARFEREARVLAALSHPNLLAIFDVGTAQGVSYAVMELLEGETLETRLRRSPLPLAGVLELGAAVAEGLAVAHANAVVHRDLKPANIFLTSAGQIKVLDFGLARIDTQSFTMSPRSGTSGKTEGGGTVTTPPAAGLTGIGRVMGTVGYMAPEQIRGESPDGRGDIFSLGCVLYEAVTGRRAFSGNSAVEILAAALRDEPAPLLPPWARSAAAGRGRADWGALRELQMLITRCLAKQPERRFQSASDLAFTLRTICSRAAESKSPLPVREHDNLPAPASRPVNRPSVAVLPLQNFSPNKLETEFLVDGMTDALIAELAKLRGLRVVSRTSVMQYKETRKLLREIAQELGADAVVEGSVLYAAPHVRITAQLIRAETEDYLWVESYQQELRDILALQSEVARTVAREVSLKLAQELPGENHHA